MTTMSISSRLADGTHPVMYQARRDDGIQELREAVEREYVHVKFTGTRGGTELGFPLDPEGSDLSEADWESGQGAIHVEGELTLDGVPVRCVADLDLSSLEGTGQLVIL